MKSKQRYWLLAFVIHLHFLLPFLVLFNTIGYFIHMHQADAFLNSKFDVCIYFSEGIAYDELLSVLVEIHFTKK